MATQSPDEMRQMYREQTQQYCAEPILAIGFVSQAGYVRGLVADALTGKAIASASPLANRVFHRQRAEVHRTTITNQLVCMTASYAYFFDFPTGGQFSVRSAPTVWQRAAFRVTADKPGRMTQHLHIEFATGEKFDLDVNYSKGPWATFSDQMLELLLHPPLV